MAEIRCPMCGRPNPAELNNCRYCRAQLKPKSSAGDQVPAPEEHEDSDWLGQLRANSASESNLTGENTASFEDDLSADEEIPEWLQRVRERNQIENPSDESTDDLFSFEDEDELTSSKGDQLNDWLNSLESVSIEQSPAVSAEKQEDLTDRLRSADFSTESSPQSEGDEEEWLKKLTTFPQSAPDEEAAPSDAPAAENIVPDWISGGELKTPSAAEPAAEEETPDWLKNLPADFNSTNEAPDWMKKSEEDSSIKPDDVNTNQLGWHESFDDEPSEFGSAGKTPDWLSGIDSAAEPTAKTEPGAIGKPDWLKAFEEPPAEEASPTAEEAPDWLKAFESDTPAETPEEKTEDADWLGAFNEATPPTAESITETPDWLKEFNQPNTDEQPQQETPRTVPDDVPAALNEQVTPDWLKAFDEEKSEETPLTESGQDPDWLKAFEEETPFDLAGASSPDQTAKQPEPFSFEPQDPDQHPAFLADETAAALTSFEEFSSDWLQDAQASQEKSKEDSVIPAFVFEDETKSSPSAESGSPFVNEDLPDWLDEDLESKPTPQTESGASGEDLALAELPGWVEAMRPVEDVIPGSVAVIDDHAVENAGPLAGLQGVLPAEKMALRYRKPPIYSARLRVSEKQQAHALLLENLLSEENALQPVQSETFSLPQNLVRTALGIILIAVLLIPLLFGTNASIPAGLASPLEKQVYDTLSSLPAGSPILLAADYEAGYAGEMRFTAVSLVEQLITRGQRITTVSTLPAGALLAQNLIDTALVNLAKYNPQAAQAYSLPNQTASLGYLAGGLASLQEFSLNPKQAAYYGLNAKSADESVWNSPALLGVNQLSDFSAVIVVTDSVETGRGWVEQTGSALDGKKLILITSAQASPLLIPYVNSGQAGGMISGLLGGTAYEQLANLPGNGAAYWSAYRFGLYAIIVVMVVGALLNLLTFVVARNKDQS